jgi:hypothetical protein
MQLIVMCKIYAPRQAMISVLQQTMSLTSGPAAQVFAGLIKQFARLCIAACNAMIIPACMFTRA